MTRQNFANLEGKSQEGAEAQNNTASDGSNAEAGKSDDDAAGDGGEDESPEKKPEKKQAKNQGSEKKYTDADVDRIVEARIAREKEKADEAAKLAGMNAAEKAEYEAEQLRKENEELKREKTISQMMKESRKELSEAGINVSDDILTMLVIDDAEKTKASVGSFKDLFKAEVDKAVAEQLKRKPPKAENGGDSGVSFGKLMADKKSKEFTN